jgi:FkbM family methyltransferase
MNEMIRKLLRTLQSEIPSIKRGKDVAYLHGRRILRIPHEKDFTVLRYFPPSSDGCYVDVGANQGQSIESILLAQPNATIVSFEANPSLAENLAQRYKHRSNIQIVPKGLSDSAGTFTLFEPSYRGFVYDGLASLDREAAASWINEETVFGFDPAKLSILKVRCQIDTLDAQRLKPIFIKIDVQGYEYNVLTGAWETLRRHEPVLLVEAFRSDTRTVRLLDELGYEEYYFDGSHLRKGAPIKGPNSFLITSGRIKTLFGVAEGNYSDISLKTFVAGSGSG